MKLVIDPEKLSKDELITALHYTATERGETPQMGRDVMSYYQLLPLEELRLKVPAKLYMPTEHRKVSALEQKRFEHQVQIIRRLSHESEKKVYEIKMPAKRNITNEVVCELMGKPWIKEAIEIAPGVVGVKLNAVFNVDLYKQRVNKIVDQKVEIVYA